MQTSVTMQEGLSVTSRWGRIDHNRDLSVITIADQPALVEKMLEILADLDKPATLLDFSIHLVIAGPKEAGAKKPGPELDDVMAELKALFAYDSYALHDRAAIRMLAGSDAAIPVGGTDGFRVEIGSRGEPGDDGRIGLDLNLYRPRTISNNGDVVVLQDTIVETSIDVRDGETTVVGGQQARRGRAGPDHDPSHEGPLSQLIPPAAGGQRRAGAAARDPGQGQGGAADLVRCGTQGLNVRGVGRGPVAQRRSFRNGTRGERGCGGRGVEARFGRGADGGRGA